MQAIANMLMRLALIMALVAAAVSCSGRWRGGDVPGSGTFRCIGACP